MDPNTFEQFQADINVIGEGRSVVRAGFLCCDAF